MKHHLLAALVCAVTTFAALPAQAAPRIGPADLKECKLEYPRASLMNEESGTVLVDLVVGANGKVSEAKVVTSSGHRSLDTGTVNLVKRCTVARGAGNYTIEYVWNLS
jgi:protein TonB